MLLCQRLKELQNFNGLMAVAGGLTSSPLSRLHQTQDLLSRDCKEVHILKSCKNDIIAFTLLYMLPTWFPNNGMKLKVPMT